MAGHSRWANVKHRKDRADKKKGKLFSRMAKEIISAVKQGGPDIKSNHKLRLVIQKAKVANFPSDNIERNIKKANASDQADFVETTYEMYGYGGVGIILEGLTDNKNRTAGDIRTVINKKGGTLASPGAVAFNFEKKGVIQVEKKKAIEDDLFLVSTESGAEDFESSEDLFIITTSPENLFKVKDAINKHGLETLDALLEMIPKNMVRCSKEDFEANQELIEMLEDLDDIDTVYHNMEMEES